MRRSILSQSVDNEYYCLPLAKELGLNVPDAEIIKAREMCALAVERFDRRWNAERTVLLRLPQEGYVSRHSVLPSSVKYESDGGRASRGSAFRWGPARRWKDRYDFMKFHVFQWLIGATDGHAKTSPYLFRLAAVIDSRHFTTSFQHFRSLAVLGIHISDLNWQWGLTHPKAKRQSIKFIRDIFGDKQRC